MDKGGMVVESLGERAEEVARVRARVLAEACPLTWPGLKMAPG